MPRFEFYRYLGVLQPLIRVDFDAGLEASIALFSNLISIILSTWMFLVSTVQFSFAQDKDYIMKHKTKQKKNTMETATA